MLAMLLLKAEGLLTRRTDTCTAFVVLLAAILARFLIRAASQSSEVCEALDWFRTAGGLPGLRNTPYAYSLPVQFFMAVFSLAPGNSALVFFQSFCLFFEIVIAWSCQRCAMSISKMSSARMSAFLAVMVLPSGVAETSVIASGSLFGWAFLLLACAFALETRPSLSAALLGVALVFQPRLIWVAPVFLVFPVLRLNPLASLGSLIGAYFLVSLPFLLAGRSEDEIFPFYPRLSQIAEAGYNQGAPGLYSLVDGWPTSPAGVIIYSALMILVIILLCRKQALRNRRLQLCGAAFSCAAAAVLLPWQESSALYGAEVFSLALCCVAGITLPATLLFIAASGIAIWRSSAKVLSLIPSGWVFMAVLAGMILLLLYMLFPRVHRGRKNRKEAEKMEAAWHDNEEWDESKPPVEPVV